MSDSNALHGPREDDALKRELRSELQAGRATRTEEWREPEPSGEDQPEATVTAGTPEGRARPAEEEQAIQTRSDLARHLGRTLFPASRAEIIGKLEENQAPQRLLDLVSGLPEQASFDSHRELLLALDLPVEVRDGRLDEQD